jgi:hypothetical protein
MSRYVSDVITFHIPSFLCPLVTAIKSKHRFQHNHLYHNQRSIFKTYWLINTMDCSHREINNHSERLEVPAHCPKNFKSICQDSGAASTPKADKTVMMEGEKME